MKHANALRLKLIYCASLLHSTDAIKLTSVLFYGLKRERERDDDGFHLEEIHQFLVFMSEPQTKKLSLCVQVLATFASIIGVIYL